MGRPGVKSRRVLAGKRKKPGKKEPRLKQMLFPFSKNRLVEIRKELADKKRERTRLEKELGELKGKREHWRFKLDQKEIFNEAIKELNEKIEGLLSEREVLKKAPKTASH